MYSQLIHMLYKDSNYFTEQIRNTKCTNNDREFLKGDLS